jgi:hypothetical protein
MTEEAEIEADDSFAGPEPKSSGAVLGAIRKAEDAFREWQTTCETIDRIYNLDGAGYGGVRSDLDGYGWQDAELDLFWSSYEVLKPAVYARPPQPVVSPLFKDSNRLHNVTAEILERCAVSVFKRTDINDVMLHIRDDLLFAGRGSLWVRHDVEKGRHSVIVEHKDRLDFLHEPARKWGEVGWVGGASWMTRKEMRKRFRPHSSDAYRNAQYTLYREDDNDRDLEKRAATRKCKVWEVWHKADGKVYWVTEGVDVLLDSGEPHLELSGFFPCPRPAYATLKRRSLVPVPDWQRYAIHFRKISELTRRVYSLLDAVRMKGLVAGGGDVGEAIEQILKDDSDEIIIPVPGAALLAHGGAPLVVWLPLVELATAIQGLIAARGQLIDDFYQLSGISDIMRGATEAEETLGAQELKSQYGSVRVREKSAELQRVAADAVKIAAEIIAEKFPKDTLVEMSQMDVLSRSAIEKRVNDIEKAAKQELEALGTEAKRRAQQQMGQMQGQQPDPAQAEAMLKQAQQQIIARYAPMLAEAESRVPLEDVIKLLRDDRVRNFVFEIESSSTILTDEMAEKRSRNEFLDRFTAAAQPLMAMAGMGEAGAKMAGALMKFVLAPYRAGRELDGAIEEFIEKAPEMAARASEQGGDVEGLAESQKMLAQAEMEKARAAMASVEARAALDKAEMQRKMLEMQQRAANDQAKMQETAEKLRQSAEANTVKAEEALAKVDLLRAQTMKALAEAGVTVSSQQLDEFKSLADIEMRSADQAMSAEDRERDAQFRERGEERADRQQDFAEHSGGENG